MISRHIAYVCITYYLVCDITKVHSETRLCTDECSRGDNFKVGGRCFFTSFQTKRTWDESEDYCKEQSCSGLAVFNLDQDLTKRLLKDMLNKWNEWHTQPSYRWVGIRPKSSGNFKTGWVWRTGESADAFMARVHIPPSIKANPPSANYSLCVMMSRLDNSILVSECSKERGYICDVTGLTATEASSETATVNYKHMLTYEFPSGSLHPDELQMSHISQNTILIITATLVVVAVAISLVTIFVCVKKRSATKNDSASPPLQCTEPASLPPASGADNTMLDRERNMTFDRVTDAEYDNYAGLDGLNDTYDEPETVKLNLIKVSSKPVGDDDIRKDRGVSAAVVEDQGELYAEVDVTKKRNRHTSQATDDVSVTMVDNSVYG